MPCCLPLFYGSRNAETPECLFNYVLCRLRFDPLKLLDILRGKRLMFIGDSVQRGQFESMVCMVQSVIPDGKKSFHRIPPMKIFKAEVLNSLKLFPMFSSKYKQLAMGILSAKLNRDCI